VLAVTSNPTRTSPVKRGRWILDNILGAPPAGPPPGVEQLADAHAAGGATLRERMERHRADPSCAACHAATDPLGFGLEAFDAIGAERTHDGGRPIDATGVLPDGRTFDGPAGLQVVLKEQTPAFTRCLTEKLFTYALGRGPQRGDRRAVADIARKLADNEYRFSALVLALVHSDPFQNRTGGDAR
jgi:mono/diheme cytochrome c family protein